MVIDACVAAFGYRARHVRQYHIRFWEKISGCVCLSSGVNLLCPDLVTFLHAEKQVHACNMDACVCVFVCLTSDCGTTFTSGNLS